MQYVIIENRLVYSNIRIMKVKLSISKQIPQLQDVKDVPSSFNSLFMD